MQSYTMSSTRGSSLSLPLLTAACHHYWGMDTLPPITKMQWGKPTFGLEGRHFNLSHSGSVALCVLSPHPVGVDIQLPRPSRPNFLDRVCSPSQRQWLHSHGDNDEAFALLWAVTESYYKFTGRGIPLPFTPTELPLPPMLPIDGIWTYLRTDNVVFSLTQMQGGMVSVCGTTQIVHPNINLSTS